MVTAIGAKTYTVGDSLQGGVVDVIKISDIFYQGDPYDHVCGFDSNGKLLFSVNCLAPCDIEYF